MRAVRVWLRAMAMGLFGVAALSSACASAVESPTGTGQAADPVHLSLDARDTLRWVRHSADNGGLPFAIVDKKQARLLVFNGQGELTGSTAVLLGLAPGDHSVPGIGQRVPLRVAPEERTTPAGRFRTEPGRNLGGEDIVWVDYAAAIAIHRVRPGPAQERREQRLASATPLDNRSSLGCIVVPVAFYDHFVAPVLGRQRGVVYVLPETQSAQAMLHAYQAGALKSR